MLIAGFYRTVAGHTLRILRGAEMLVQSLLVVQSGAVSGFSHRHLPVAGSIEYFRSQPRCFSAFHINKNSDDCRLPHAPTYHLDGNPAPSDQTLFKDLLKITTAKW